MASKKSISKVASGSDSQILSYRHPNKRVNNPDVGLVNPETDPAQPKTTWAYDPHLDPALQFDVRRAQIEKLIDDALASGDQATMHDTLAELKRLQSPYLNWSGKAERTSFDIDTVSLHVHERIDPASILSAIRKNLKEGKNKKPSFIQPGLFDAPFENVPLRDAIDFYRHERGWANRMIAGDSLLVMNSLLQKESMAGQVQMIYIDPPYGIKYGSNFQPFVNKRDVKDRKDEDLTQEPEMIKAFRDTWELGIHSYLTYLRDRLLLSKDLLHESGSVFVQISDENLHHVREVMDEIFGVENFVAVITFVKATAQTTDLLSSNADYIVWYARERVKVKYHQPLQAKELGGDGSSNYGYFEDTSGKTSPLNKRQREDENLLPVGARVFSLGDFTSQRPPGSFPVSLYGETYLPGKNYWKTSEVGILRIAKVGRAVSRNGKLYYKRYLDDFPCFPLTTTWTDTASSFSERTYVVQTTEKVIERCLLMTTDPGDLALDITCGSGTTAFVAEKWGRRWITCDTSRVAVTLAKQRLMTASYDYYELKYPHEGLKSGFIYKTVPHVTLKSIANNPDIDSIYERMHPVVEAVLAELNALLVGAPSGAKIAAKAAPTGALREWEVPFEFPADWLETARKPFATFHAARQSMQKQMDASIAAHADQETLYDQPEKSKTKLRITGPFTVEAVPFPTVYALEEAEQPQEADVAIARSGESSRQHQWRDELLKTGIRGKGGQMLKFAELETLPGTRYLHASGTLADTGERTVVSFGPEHATLEQRQVALALDEAAELFPRPKVIVFCAFAFDPEAAKDIDHLKGITALKAQMNTDLLTEDLKKGRSSNQSFWLMGQPDVEVRKIPPDGTTDMTTSHLTNPAKDAGQVIGYSHSTRPSKDDSQVAGYSPPLTKGGEPPVTQVPSFEKGGRRGATVGAPSGAKQVPPFEKGGRRGDLYEVEVHGFDYFDTAKGELVSGGKNKIAVWMLDTDYDDRSLFPRQVFFPLAGKDDGWFKLKKNIRAELDEERMEAFHGTVSLPFEAGDHRKVAVKIVDDRGIESLKIISLEGML